MKKKRGIAWLLGLLLVVSLVWGTGSVVQAEEDDSGEEKTISVSLKDNGLLDMDGNGYSMKIDGVAITPGSVKVKLADTHTISVGLQYMCYN